MFAAPALFKLRAIRRLSLGAAALGLLSTAAVSTAFADANINFGVEAGSLEIATVTQPTFGNVPFQLTGTPQETDGDYVYTVADGTGNLTEGWTVSVVGENLTSGANSIPVGNIVLTNDGVTSEAGDDTTNVTPAAPLTMTTSPQTVLSAEGTAGDGVYEHTVNVEVTVPNMTAAGSYTGTLVFTVAAEAP